MWEAWVDIHIWQPNLVDHHSSLAAEQLEGYARYLLFAIRIEAFIVVGAEHIFLHLAKFQVQPS
jgi:hypothetical protein